MKYILLIQFIFVCSCANDDINKCIDQEKWGEITACSEHLDYVCGCNNVTYGNDCFAKVAGVVSWTEGECK